MRRTGFGITVGGLVLALCATASAQERQPGEREREAARPGQAQHFCLASKVMDKQVQDRSGQPIGSLQDLVIDSQGQVRYIALQPSGSKAGASGADRDRDAQRKRLQSKDKDEAGAKDAAAKAGQGGEYVLVPFEAVNVSQSKQGESALKLKIAADDLEKAPRFSQQQIGGESQQWMAEVDRFFKIERGTSARPELRDKQDPRRPNEREKPKDRDQN